MNHKTSNITVEKPEVDDSRDEHCHSLVSSSDHDLRVTVVSTNREGTQAALQVASKLANGLSARITLLVIHEVPFHFPLENPPVSLDFLERNQMGLVYESGLDADEVSIEVILCRNRKDCLKRVLRPRSLLIVGGKRRHWLNEERKLERWLDRMGHHAVYVEIERLHRAGLNSYFCVPLRRMCARSNPVERPAILITENLNNRSIS